MNSVLYDFQGFIRSIFQSSQSLEWGKCRIDGCYREAVRESLDGNLKEVRRNGMRDSVPLVNDM